MRLYTVPKNCLYHYCYYFRHFEENEIDLTHHLVCVYSVLFASRSKGFIKRSSPSKKLASCTKHFKPYIVSRLMMPMLSCFFPCRCMKTSISSVKLEITSSRSWTSMLDAFMCSVNFVLFLFAFFIISLIFYSIISGFSGDCLPICFARLNLFPNLTWLLVSSRCLFAVSVIPSVQSCNI